MTSPESRKPSLLIVDDDRLIIDTLAFFLSREFEISTAASRTDCIALLRSQGQVMSALECAIFPSWRTSARVIRGC